MSANRFSVLVVDEDLEAGRAIQAVLVSEAVSVLTAPSHASALAQLQTQDIAMALLAVRQPGMDAFALARALRSSARSRHVPIVLLVPAGEDVQIPEMAPMDADAAAIDVLYTPVNAAVLVGKVKLFCDLQRQSRLLAQRLTELDRASQFNALMLAALSHDIRTPLASLSLNAEVVLRRADSPGVRQAGERIKAAAAALGRQVDHLVNLSQLPPDALRPEMAPSDLSRLVAERIEHATEHLVAAAPIELTIDGDARASFDAAMMSQALDQLMLLTAVHGQGQAVSVSIHGHARHTLVLRISMPAVLSDAVRLHLFGGGTAIKGLPAMRVGPGLDAVEQIARAHGGSLIGRSRVQDGTFFELVLPRSG